MSIAKMVDNIKLAPGISVYKLPKEMVLNWYSIIKNYSEPLLKYGTILSKNENGYYSTVSLDHRKCKIFSTGDFAQCHNDDPLKIITLEVENEMQRVVDLFCTDYMAHKAVKNHDVIFLRYESGDYFRYHNDDCPTYHRTVSAISYFNDDYEGGELSFRFFDVQYKPEAGDCIVFSSAFPYMHSVNEVKNGVRYAAVNWYKYV
jgi:hypothetical protein